jgi:hypothetical protein
MRQVVAGAFVLLLGVTVHAQSGVKLELVDVVDDRISAGMMRGSLQLQANLTGTGLDRINAARLIVKEAKDDRGNDLLADREPPDFSVKGTIEMFVPARDPSTTLKVPNALGKLDAPINHKGLKAAKMSITPLSPAQYAKVKESQKITEADLEKIRAEGKAQGVDQKEIEMAIEFAQLMSEMDGPLPENAIILSGKEKDFDRIQSLEFLGSDGEPINITSRSSSTRGDDVLQVLQPSGEVPRNATMQLIIMTDKSKMSVPFELKNVPLP